MNTYSKPQVTLLGDAGSLIQGEKILCGDSGSLTHTGVSPCDDDGE